MMSDWFHNDELFFEQLAVGHQWAEQVATRFRWLGLEATASPLVRRDSIADRHDFRDEVDLVVGEGRTPIEVKSRAVEFFETALSFPYETAFVDTVRGWNAKSQKPVAIILVSQRTGAMLVVPGESSAQWTKTHAFDRVRQISDEWFCAPRSVLVPFPVFAARILRAAGTQSVAPIQLPAKSEAVLGALKALAADHARQDGLLAVQDVERVARRRELSQADFSELVGLLETAGLWSRPRASRRQSKESSSHGPMGDGISLFLADVGRHDLLTYAEEQELGKRIKLAARYAGRESSAEVTALLSDAELARERLIVANLRLVVSIAKRHVRTSSLDLMDLVQEGTLGLHRAVEKFDPDLGLKFSTYATWWIRQSIARGIANTGSTIRFPVHVHEQMKVLRRTRRSLQAEGLSPTLERLSNHLLWKPEEVQFLLDIEGELSIGSLDQPVQDDSGMTVGDFVADRTPGPEEMLEIVADREMALRLLDALSEREKDVLRLRFGFDGAPPATLEKIGEEFGVTRERIRQIEAKAIKRLQQLHWAENPYGTPHQEETE